MKRILDTLGLVFGLLIANFLSNIVVALTLIPLLGESDKNAMLAITLANILTIGIMYLFYGKEDRLVEKCNFKKINIKDAFYITLLGIGLSSVISLIMTPIINIFPSYMELSNKMLSFRASILSVICMVVLIPICEEIIFRGIIFDHLKRNYSIITAIIVQALLFGLFHGNIVQGIYTFLSGIIFVLANIYCGSILGGIILHIIMNLLGASGIQELLGFSDLMYTIEYVGGVVLFIYASYKMIKNYKKRICDCKVS